MIWVVRLATVVLCVLFAAALKSAGWDFSTWSVMEGLALSIVILRLSRWVALWGARRQVSDASGAARAALLGYWIGNALAFFSVALAASSVFIGASDKVAIMPVLFAATYWIGGWGLRRALSQPVGGDRGTAPELGAVSTEPASATPGRLATA